MYLNPVNSDQLARTIQSVYMKSAAQYRLQRQASADKPSRRLRLPSGLSQLFNRFGQKSQPLAPANAR